MPSAVLSVDLKALEADAQVRGIDRSMQLRRAYAKSEQRETGPVPECGVSAADHAAERRDPQHHAGTPCHLRPLGRDRPDQ